MDPQVESKIQNFIASSPSQALARQQCEDFVAKSDPAVVAARFAKRLEFGTAGLRGVMGPGFNAMNHTTVLHAAQGLCSHVLNTFGEESKSRGVVVGFDGRYNSESFAHITTAVFLSRGYRVYLFSKLTATPWTPYAILKFNCLCGIQVTASHNPKVDNGYKVYWANGAQINTPIDSDISKAITENSTVWPGVTDLLTEKLTLIDRSLAKDPYMDIRSLYRDEITKELSTSALPTNSDFKFVYTAMHGVGTPAIKEIMRHNNLGSSLVLVEEQAQPDPEFSTVSFPNPEEKGALDLSKATAEKCGATMIIANDPDADRLAACEKLDDGSWYIFKGDEIGVILGLRCRDIALKRKVPAQKMLFVNSLVSSQMLRDVVMKDGSRHENTLTGFKWIMNCALNLRDTENFIPVFCYEEALGYGCSMAVPDKDGVSAALVWIQLTIELANQGKTMVEHLDSIRKEHGYYVSYNGYYVCPEKSTATSIFADFRKNYPEKCGPCEIIRIRDGTIGYDSGTSLKETDFDPVKPNEMVTLFLSNGAAVTFRTSGTEAKIKFYSELCGPDPEAAKKILEGTVKVLCAQILKPEKNSLGEPKVM